MVLLPSTYENQRVCDQTDATALTPPLTQKVEQKEKPHMTQTSSQDDIQMNEAKQQKYSITQTHSDKGSTAAA